MRHSSIVAKQIHEWTTQQGFKKAPLENRCNTNAGDFWMVFQAAGIMLVLNGISKHVGMLR